MAATQGGNLAPKSNRSERSLEFDYAAIMSWLKVCGFVNGWVWTDATKVTEASAFSRGTGPVIMNSAVMSILAFYGAAPHMCDIGRKAVKSIVTRIMEAQEKIQA